MAKKKNKKKKSKESQAVLEEKMTLFNKLGEECNACKKHFDKKSREQAMTWKVFVKESEKSVRLFCPECWGKAQTLIKGIKK
jgi:hypothetical protein